MIGTSSTAISRRLNAMASATPRSSDSMPGNAAGVSTNDDDRAAELLGHAHGPQRLAVALRAARSRSCAGSSPWSSGPSGGPPRGRGAPWKVRDAADDGRVVGKPRDRRESRRSRRTGARCSPACRARAAWRATCTHLPWRQRGEQLGTKRAGAGHQAFDVRGTRLGARHHAHRLDFLHEDADGFFEVEQVGRHSNSRGCFDPIAG